MTKQTLIKLSFGIAICALSTGNYLIAGLFGMIATYLTHTAIQSSRHIQSTTPKKKPDTTRLTLTTTTELTYRKFQQRTFHPKLALTKEELKDEEKIATKKEQIKILGLAREDFRFRSEVLNAIRSKRKSDPLTVKIEMEKADLIFSHQPRIHSF